MNTRHILSLLMTLAAAVRAIAATPYGINYSAEVGVNAGGSDFAPYYLASNNFGTVTQPYSTLGRVKAWRGMSTESRFSFGFGADIVGGYASSTPYERFVPSSGTLHAVNRHPANLWLQQLYAEVKYRCLFLTAGLKEVGSALLDDRLSSGDITWSANSRPMPGVRAGFHDFEAIPGINGWIEINGVLFYGRPTDNDWLTEHYNHYNSFITTGRWINYKRIYFRTKPSMPFSVTLGMQAAAQFAGTQATYMKGERTTTVTSPLRFSDFIDMLVPHEGDDYWKGNHLGSWDFVARYRLKNGQEFKAYFQWPWEDGSGIGKLNGFDGLWGLEYRNGGKGPVTAAVIEYLDFTNQSGPLHWDPVDNAGTTITNQATGADSYYNNYFYNGYAVYGMSQGTPFLMSPLYNLNGYMQYADTRVRGFHAAAEGCITSRLSYRVMVSYRLSYGDSYAPRLKKVHDTSWMAEGEWQPASVPGMSLKCQIAMDRGDMYGNNTGAMVTLSYRGLIKISRK